MSQEKILMVKDLDGKKDFDGKKDIIWDIDGKETLMVKGPWWYKAL